MWKKTFTSKAAFRSRVRKHLTVYKCEVCYKKFRSLDDAKSHGKKPYGKVKETENIIKMKESEDITNVDCSKCKAKFNTQDDYYKHANNCNEVLDM